MSDIVAKSWKDDYYVTVFQLAKDGMGDGDIAQTIGVPFAKFKGWVKMKPALRRGLEKARSGAKKEGYSEFRAFIYEKLPRRARELWDELELVDKMPDADPGKRRKKADIFRLIDSGSTKIRQHLFLHALIKCNFIIGRACSKVGIERNLVDQWKRTSIAFKHLVEGIIEYKKDFFESCLIDLVRSGDSAATIFANKSVNKDRGYDQRLTIETTGSVVHKHQVGLEELPVDARRAILEAMRKKTLAIEDKSNIIDVEAE